MAKKLQRKVAPRPAATAPQSAPAKSPRGSLFASRRVSRRGLAEFTSQLAVLLQAGIPITKALRILEGQIPQGMLKRTIADVLEDVEGGTALSEAFGKHGTVFDELYTSMVRAGEAGGVQEEILGRLAAFMEKAEDVRSKVKGALAYPIAVVSVAVLVLVLVFIFVIPRFKQIFASQAGGIDKLPGATQVLIAVGEHLQAWWWAWALGVIGVFAAHRALLKNVPAYRRAWDRLLLRLPIFGRLTSKVLVARFTRTFGTLIQSGVPHLRALEIVQSSAGNVHMVAAVGAIHASIREGAGIAVPMGHSGMFDDIIVNMVDVGEQTGELDRMLTRIADRYEMEVDRTIQVTLRAVESLLIVVLAVFVGFIVYSLLAPLLKLMQEMS
ncbi:MAG: type II secretion system F family protein [Planctomycetes bacterium]|nr:type II secretion system F family protein [Planctomycetota bacterium]